MFLIILVLFTSFIALEAAARLSRRPILAALPQSVMAMSHGIVVLLIAAMFYMEALPWFRPYAYADDWALTVPLTFHTAREWGEWLIVQHVDHRIPIQKAVSYAILRATGFDFRYVVAVNYGLAIGVAGLLLAIARRYRDGTLTAGDMIIPFILLNFASGGSLWGFQFAFISSIAGFAAFLYLATREAYVGAAAVLIATALCGMNGVLFATVGTLGMLLTQKRPAVFLTALAVEGVLWATWHPSGASDVGGGDILTYLWHLLPASMSVAAFDDLWWKAAIVAALFGWAMVITARLSIWRTLTTADYVLALGAVASFVVMLSVAVGRAKAQGPWTPVLAMHYGAMSVFIPVCSWLIISKRLPGRTTALVGLGLAGVAFAGWFVDLQWRQHLIMATHKHQAEVMAVLRTSDPAADVAKRYIADLSLPGHEAEVAAGIEALRRARVKNYLPRSPPS